jgi:copper transport protein
MYMSDLVHGIVGAIWFGGLIGLARYLLLSGRHDPVAGVHVVTRFSFIAGVAFALAAFSGTVMAVRILENFDALFDTTFGRILLAKIAVLVIPFVIAAWNRFRLVPAVTREPDADAGWRRLRGTVLAEITLLIVVIGLTGFLVLQSPRVSEAASDGGVATVPFEETKALGDGTIAITISPAGIGDNQIVVEVRDANNQPLELVDAVTVQLTLPAANLGPLEFTAEQTGAPGQYTGIIQAPLYGDWDVTLVTRISRFEQPTTTFIVPFPNTRD